MTSAITQALEALQLGRDAAYEVAQTYHASMKGYRQQRHDQLDATGMPGRVEVNAG